MISNNEFRLASASDLISNHYKERPPLLGNLSIGGSAQDLYRWYDFNVPISEIKDLFSRFELQVVQNGDCRNGNGPISGMFKNEIS